MIRTLTATALAITLATSPSLAVSSFDIKEIQGYAPNADLSGLSERQVQLLLNIIHGNTREGRKYQQVRGFLLRAEGRSLLQELFQ